MRHRRFLSHLLLTFVAPHLAHAGEAARISLGVGTQSCPTESAIRATLQGDHVLDSVARVDVTIAAAGRSRWRADIVMTEAGGPRFLRQIDVAGSCADLVAATAVAVRLALDRPQGTTQTNTAATPLTPSDAADLRLSPAAVATTIPPRSEPPRIPEDASAPSPLALSRPPATASPPSALAVAPPATVTKRASSNNADVTPNASPTASGNWEVGLALGAATGLAPDFASQLRATVGRLHKRHKWLTELALTAPNASATSLGPLQVSSLVVGAVPCWRAHPMSLCAAVHVGALAAEAAAVNGAETRVSPLALAGARLELDLFRAGSWTARLHVNGQAHLLRTRVQAQDTRLWTMPSAAFAAGLQVGRVFF